MTPNPVLSPIADPARALTVRGLRKSFGRAAVDDLDLTVRAGEFYALLGPNGAGKTTTLRMIAGLMRPDAGSIAVFGIDAVAQPIEAKRVVAWLPDDPMIYDKLTPLEYLDFIAALWGLTPDDAQMRAAALLRQLDLWPQRNQLCESFSRGMKQKVGLAGALVHEPRLLILDEPLTGLDAASARDVKAILADRIAAGATVIMTTHILEVAERLADRIGIIRSGRMVAEGTARELAHLSGAAGGSLEDTFLTLTKMAQAA